MGGLVPTLFDHVSSERSHWDTTLDEANAFLINLIYSGNYHVDLLLSKHQSELLIQSAVLYFQLQMFYQNTGHTPSAKGSLITTFRSYIPFRKQFNNHVASCFNFNG